MPVQKRYQAVIRQFVHLAHERYHHGIERIILYGSVARGDAGPDSDIDLLVLWKGDEREGWRAMTSIAFDVMVATGALHISQSDGCRHLFRIFRFRTECVAGGDRGLRDRDLGPAWERDRGAWQQSVPFTPHIGHDLPGQA